MVEAYVGEIKMLAFNFAPTQWALCNGQTIAITQNQALFALIGTVYGGNGVNNFLLPNLQSRVPVGFGQGTGLSPYVLGQVSGSEQMTLTTQQLPIHTHTATFTPSGGGSAAAVQALTGVPVASLTAAPADGSYLANTGPANANQPKIYAPAGSGTPVNLGGVSGGGGGGGTVTNATTGQSLPFGLLQPYLAINFSISLYGVFPTRN